MPKLNKCYFASFWNFWEILPLIDNNMNWVNIRFPCLRTLRYSTDCYWRDRLGISEIKYFWFLMVVWIWSLNLNPCFDLKSLTIQLYLGNKLIINHRMLYIDISVYQKRIIFIKKKSTEFASRSQNHQWKLLIFQLLKNDIAYCGSPSGMPLYRCGKYGISNTVIF